MLINFNLSNDSEWNCTHSFTLIFNIDSTEIELYFSAGSVFLLFSTVYMLCWHRTCIGSR